LAVAIGVDSHKETLAAAAVDEVGRRLESQVFANDPKGHHKMFEWIVAHGPERVTGIECSGSYGAALAWYLMDHGENVREVPTGLSYRERKRKRSDGKSDEVDALAIARVTAREQNLPVPKQAGIMVDLKLLNDHRDDLIRHRTRLSNQAHHELVILRPGYQTVVKSLRSKKHVVAALALIEGDSSIRAELTRDRLKRRLQLDDEIYRLGKRIQAKLVESKTTLTQLKGAGTFVAAKILGEVGDVSRIRSKAAFASLAGTAPVPASSGQRNRHRLNRGGNRQLNHALHVIAKAQSRIVPEVRVYVGKKMEEGKSYKEGLRCLQRHLSNVIYKTLVEDAKRVAVTT
jgi:transposase